MFVVVAVFFLCGCSSEEGMIVRNAWIRPTAQGENSAIYFVLSNHSDATDRLLEVSSTVAESVEIHESSMTEGTDVMQMNRVFTVPLDFGSEIIFEPGGLHVMLINITRDLIISETIEITLHFRNYEDVPVNVLVSEFAPAEDHSH